ncbi:MAG: type II toxin-antitoxin system HicB family antitoxin [Pirellulales bacterium]|nr:type II toxin-antitoxin system HicB family antitoxin [Pirellulales bacterium]
MTPIDIELVPQNVATTIILDPEWDKQKAYRCHVSMVQEEDGCFSAIVLNLPGAGSCGDSEEEALENVREAVLGVIESHVEAGEEIPWLGLDEYEIPKGAPTKWILVNA